MRKTGEVDIMKTIPIELVVEEGSIIEQELEEGEDKLLLVADVNNRNHFLMKVGFLGTVYFLLLFLYP